MKSFSYVNLFALATQCFLTSAKFISQNKVFFDGKLYISSKTWTTIPKTVKFQLKATQYRWEILKLWVVLFNSFLRVTLKLDHFSVSN